MNNIVLCGFMGCGKSSVGRVLAELLGRELIDTDEYIEQVRGVSISQIFERDGEDKFRDIEHDACVALSKRQGLVIATGGGALTFERNVEAFRNDTVIFMDVPFDEIARRIGSCADRPLFRDESSARDLYERRLPLYRAAADCTVYAVGDKSEIANRIIKMLRVR